LYVASFAPNPRRVRIYLREKGITDIEIVKLDMMQGEHRTDEFKADKNPLAALPVLELDDGATLTESQAIIEYLEELYPEPSLLGTTPLERARTREVSRIAELGMLFGAATAFQNSSPFFAGRFEQSEAAATVGRKRFGRHLRHLDELLAKNTWLAGDNFSIADITALCAIDFGKVSGCTVDGEKVCNVARWLTAIRERPSCAVKKKS